MKFSIALWLHKTAMQGLWVSIMNETIGGYKISIAQLLHKTDHVRLMVLTEGHYETKYHKTATQNWQCKIYGLRK